MATATLSQRLPFRIFTGFASYPAEYVNNQVFPSFQVLFF